MKHKCSNCGTEFEGNFCPECGTKWQEEKTCPQCGTHLAGSARFCNNCGYSFRAPSEPQAAPPAPSSVKARVSPALCSFLHYLPMVLLALVSALTFLLFLAPVAIMPGGDLLGEKIPSESYGNVFEIGNYADSTLPASLTALIVFAALALFFAFVSLASRCGPFKKAMLYVFGEYRSVSSLATVAGYLCIFAEFIISCALFGLIGEFDGGLEVFVAGAAPVLVLVFSLLCLSGAIAAAIAKHALGTHNAEAKAIFKELNRRPMYNAKKAAAIARAQKSLVKPQKPAAVKKPSKPRKPVMFSYDILSEEERTAVKPKVDAYLKGQRTTIILTVLSIIFGVILDFAISLSLIFGRPLFSWLILVLVPFVIIVIPIGALILIRNRKRPIKGWHPEKVYKKHGIRVTVTFVAYLLISIAPMPFGLFGTVAVALLYFVVWTVVLAIRYSKAKKKRIGLTKTLSGCKDPERDPAFLAPCREKYRREMDEYNALLELYKKDLAAYREYSRQNIIYSYQIARYNNGKSYQNASYRKMWCFSKRFLLSAATLALAAVIVVGCTLGTIETHFTVGTVKKINVGDLKTRVEQVLGEPYFQAKDVWTYYSRKPRSILEKMDELSEKMADAEPTEWDELIEEYNELVEQQKQIIYKTISVTFTNDAVSSLRLNATAQVGEPSSKEVTSVTFSPSSIKRGNYPAEKVVYAVKYKDGSYATAYLPSEAAALINVQKTGTYTVKWSDDWGNYSADFYIN